MAAAAASTTFHFRAVTPDGKVRTGSLAADSEKLVASELRRQGLTPVFIGRQAQESGWSFKLPAFGAKSRKGVLFFTGEMATLLNSGIPLDRALQIATELTDQAELKSVLQEVLRAIKGGKSMADALGQHPLYFSELYVNMVRAGEASGSLAQVFERLAEFERTRDELRNYIIGSMVYPGLLSIVGLGSILVLMYYVVPRFASVFETGQMKMPLPTQIMIETSNFIRAWGWLAAVATALGITGFQVYTGTPEGRLWWDTTRLRIPLLGDALRKAETARFARAMATLVSNSVPLVQSIGIARAILVNKRMAGSLDAVSQGIKRGEGIAEPLRKTGQFPPLASHLLNVGEETGKLDAMFTRMADIYETETRDAIKRFTALFEPLIILIMGIVVGALILSMLIAITSINEVAG
ncbi:MAG: type II secretion system F family protein [Bryobacterales bacterium]|nr:type II secretion system F family protein [Bryobacterales bacterium]